MKNTPAQSATSLPRAPRDDAHVRMTKYFTMMSIRVACFVLMVLVQPYGWYTWLFAIGAVFLPYVAVVVANVSSGRGQGGAVSPERSLPAAPAASTPPPSGVIRIQESDPSGPDPQ